MVTQFCCTVQIVAKIFAILDVNIVATVCGQLGADVVTKIFAFLTIRVRSTRMTASNNSCGPCYQGLADCSRLCLGYVLANLQRAHAKRL